MKQPDIPDLLRRLHDATGFRISIHDREMHEIAAYPENHLAFCRILHANESSARICFKSDADAFRCADGKKGLHIYKCPFGLFEAVCPLYRYGAPVGYLMMGQVTESNADAADAARRAGEFCPDRDALSEAARSIPHVSHEMMRAYADIMSVFADYMTVSNLINVKTAELPARIYDFLLTHFAEKSRSKGSAENSSAPGHTSLKPSAQNTAARCPTRSTASVLKMPTNCFQKAICR